MRSHLFSVLGAIVASTTLGQSHNLGNVSTEDDPNDVGAFLLRVKHKLVDSSIYVNGYARRQAYTDGSFITVANVSNSSLIQALPSHFFYAFTDNEHKQHLLTKISHKDKPVDTEVSLGFIPTSVWDLTPSFDSTLNPIFVRTDLIGNLFAAPSGSNFSDSWNICKQDKSGALILHFGFTAVGYEPVLVTQEELPKEPSPTTFVAEPHHKRSAAAKLLDQAPAAVPLHLKINPKPSDSATSPNMVPPSDGYGTLLNDTLLQLLTNVTEQELANPSAIFFFKAEEMVNNTVKGILSTEEYKPYRNETVLADATLVEFYPGLDVYAMSFGSLTSSPFYFDEDLKLLGRPTMEEGFDAWSVCEGPSSDYPYVIFGQDFLAGGRCQPIEIVAEAL